MKTILHKTMQYIFVLLFTVFAVINSVTSIALADTVADLEYDKTNVLDDLRSSESIDLTDYPANESGTMQVINFVEYCYSYRANLRSNYGLYIYVYNPQVLNINTSSRSNKLQMAVAYGKDVDGNTVATDYEKFDLEFCSISLEPNYYRLFYKFKVVDRKGKDGKKVVERVNSAKRRYDVSGIELIETGKSNAKDYTIAWTYEFTGFAKGYGLDTTAESNLEIKQYRLDTVELDVKHTFYRTKSHSSGAGWQNQLDTVYFSVPQKFFDMYGKLQRIKAEWYEYKTKDIIVTSNSDFYNSALPYLGVPVIKEYDKWGYPKYNSDVGYSLGQDAGDAGDMSIAKWGWNLGNEYLHPYADVLYYLFLVDSIDEYDPYADIVDIGGVGSNALYERIKNYDKSFNNGTLPIKHSQISADLFESDIDDYRKMDTTFGKIQQGYSYYDFDADVDLQHLNSWQSTNPSFWDNWVNWGLWDAIIGNYPKEETVTLSPIEIIDSNDVRGTAKEVSDKLYVNSADVSMLQSYVSTATSKNEVVVLFRFATTDYYSAPVDIMQLGKGFLGSDKHISGQAYRAFESVFLDFDIIQLTFYKDGVYHVIPVISSPIDIVNAITPPVQMPDGINWLQIILMVLMLIVLFILLAPVLPHIISFIVTLVGWVFKILFYPFRVIGKLIKKFKDKEAGGR